MSDQKDNSQPHPPPDVVDPNIVQSSTPSPAQSSSPSVGPSGQPDFAAMMAYLERRDQLQEERYRRLEQQLEEQKRYAREYLNDQRISMGESLRVPESALRSQPQQRSTARRVEFPSTPVMGLSVDSHERDGRGAEKRRMSDEEALERALKLIRGFVPMFHANTAKDKGTTVDDFVEKVESAMVDVLRDHPHVKLSVVRMCLLDGALRWFNRRIDKLKAAGVDEPLWERDVRTAFIDEHNGTNTPELWLAKLNSLRLGKGTTPTPIELDNQFDTIARHLLQDPSNEDANNLFLSTEYGTIIRNSNFDMYSTILRSCPHSTLRQWKTAVAQQWNAEAVLKATDSRRPTAGSSGGWRGGRGGRGGHYPTGEAKGAKEPMLNAAGTQGEEYTVEGENEGQLQLTATSSSRGGRGGRGGRGRGNGNRGASMSEERQRLYDERRCFRCHQIGHTQFACPTPPEPRGEQSKE